MSFSFRVKGSCLFWTQGTGRFFVVFATAVSLILIPSVGFSEDTRPGGAAGSFSAEVDSPDTGRIGKYLDQAETYMEQEDFRKARAKLQEALALDNRNQRARRMLARLDQEEALAGPRKRSSFFGRMFSFGGERAERPDRPVKAGTSDKFHSYMERARSNLSAGDFTPARRDALRAAEFSDDKEEVRKLLSEIDTAEGLFRQKHGIPSPGSVRERTLPAEVYLRERERYERRKKLEDLALRESMLEARKYLEKGEYEKARRKAYDAWKKIPYDEEVAVLIADINKGIVLGPELVKTDLREDEVLIEHRLPSERDPLTRHEEGKSFPDLGPMFMRSLRTLLDEKTYEMDYVYPTETYSIDDCVEIALMNSQRMVFANEQIKLGDTRIWELRRRLLPDVAFKAERSYGKIADSTRISGETDDDQVQKGATRHYQGKKYMVELNHTLFDGFGTYFEIRQAQANHEVIKKEGERIRNDIIEETKRAYYSLDRAKKATVIQNNIADRIERTYEIARRAHQKGLIPAVEYLKVKGQYVEAEFQRISARRDEDLARLMLAQAMNIDPDRPVEIEPMEVPEEFLNIGLQNCYNLAYSNNPDLRIKELTIEYYDYERKVTKARGWPKIDFMGNFGKAFENYQPLRYESDWTDANPIRADRGLEPEWYAGIKARVPFWGSTFEYNYVREKWATTVSAFRGTESATSYFTFNLLDDMGYFTGVQESRVGFERAKYEYQKARNDIGMQVKTSFFKYRRALLQMDVAKAQVEHQKMFVSVLEERQKFGELDMSRLVEEYVKLGEHKYGEIAGYTDYFMSILELNSAIGVMDYFDPLRPSFAGRRSDPFSVAERYMSMARDELAVNRFSSARKLAVRAAELEQDHPGVRELLGRIDRAEGLYRQGKEPAI